MVRRALSAVVPEMRQHCTIFLQAAMRFRARSATGLDLRAPNPTGEPLSERSPPSIPWRERPREMAAWFAKPAASDAVAHATAERALAPSASAVSPLEAAMNSTRNLRKNLMDFSTLFSQWSRPSDRNG